MTTRTKLTQGLDKPHKNVPAVPGIGSKFRNARSINTSQDGHNPNVGKGLPNTYFGNSKACKSTDKGQH